MRFLDKLGMTYQQKRVLGRSFLFLLLYYKLLCAIIYAGFIGFRSLRLLAVACILSTNGSKLPSVNVSAALGMTYYVLFQCRRGGYYPPDWVY